MMSVGPVSGEQENQEHVSQEENVRTTKRESFSEMVLSFKAGFEQQENLEERLKMAIAFMRESLSQEKTPRFKDFWEAKKMCLPLFKEKINPVVKSECWNEYTSLSSEVKRLKDLLEEQSAFAIEQIELALQALEEDLSQSQALIQKLPSLGPMVEGTFLAEKEHFYDQMQQEILFYANLAGRMKDLRKEVIETEMRIRHKNRLLKRLSALGDRFLPHKRDQMKRVSQEFVNDVRVFVTTYFDVEHRRLLPSTMSAHLLRESIKELQLLAKKLALNARAFSETRTQLSQCWEILREAEQEKRQEFLERQEKLKQEGELAIGLIDAFSQHFKEHPPATKEEVNGRAQQVMTELESKGLSGSDFKMLRARLRKAQEVALEPFFAQERVHLAKKEEQEAQRRQELELFKQELHQLLTHVEQASFKSLCEVYEMFEEKKKALRPDLRESQKLEELKKELYEALLLKKEKELADEDRAGIEELVQEWEAFREATRIALERYRKEMGNSGFDFEKAMMLSKRVDFEKARLDRAVEKILDLEDRWA